MNIVYSASDLYSSLAGISLTSIFENNKWADEINVFVMDNGIGIENKDKLYSLANKYGRKLSFFFVSRKPDTG